MDDDGRFCPSNLRGITPGPLAEECSPSGEHERDIDDISGYGPETVALDAATGTYLVAAFYYAGSVDVGLRVRVLVDGVPRAEHPLIASDDEWAELALVRIDEGVACVRDAAAPIADEVCLPRGGAPVCAGETCGPGTTCTAGSCAFIE